MTTASAPLRIDIISDVMCPWCVIGYRQLAQALADKNTAHEIHWHPFELNPDMAADGQDLGEHLAEKYGVTPEQSAQNRIQITQLGADQGFEFAFTDDLRMYNTFNTHQLLHWADGFNKKHALKQALFSAHFTDHRDLSDNNVLADIAAENGLEHAEALAVLADQRFASEVRTAQQYWMQNGIRGVPAVVFNNRHLVTGAQGVDTYSNILAQLENMAD